MTFSNGWVARPCGQVLLYYASSDTRCHVATTTVERLVNYCVHTPRDPLRSAPERVKANLWHARRRRAVRMVAWGAGVASAAGIVLAFVLIPWLGRKRGELPSRPIEVVTTEPPASEASPKMDEEAPRRAPAAKDAEEEPYARQARAIRALAAHSTERAARAFWTECSRSASMEEFVAATLPELDEMTVARLAAAVRAGAWPGEGRPAVQRDVARGLVASGASLAWPVLAALLERCGPTDDIARSVGELGDIRAVPLLERWINVADDRALAVIDALERMQRPAALRPLVDLFERASLAPRLLSVDRRELLAAVLRRNKGTAIALLENDCRAPRTCQAGVRAFVTLFPEAAGESFDRLAREATPMTRAWIFEGLSMLGSDDAVRTLIACLEDAELAPAARTTLRVPPEKSVLIASGASTGSEKNA